MKYIYIILFTAMSLFTGSLFTSCGDNDTISTADINDNPRILDPVFPDRTNGSLPIVANIYRDSKFSMNLTVTPADYTNVRWYLDSTLAYTGKDIDTTLLAGTYYMKVIATTDAGKSTFREGIIQVNPLTNDPSTVTKGFERYVGPGQEAILYGNNLNKVKTIIIGTQEVNDLTYIESTNGNYLKYTVPASIKDGDYRIVLEDEEGNKYGGNLLHIISTPLVTSGFSRATADAPWTITGVNIEQIASLSINGKAITEFTNRTNTSLTFICPTLADGEYELTGKTQHGEDVKFYASDGIMTYAQSVISTEKTLWSGHHYVSWELSDGNPNKTFNFIGKDVFEPIKAGATLRIHYTLDPSAGYHQIEVTTNNWDLLPGTQKTDLASDGVFEVVLTQEVLNAINQFGFLCVGHGYYVDTVTLK